MRITAIILLFLVILSQPACFWKLWSKGPPPEERTFDIYGTVQSVTADRVEIKTNKGVETFLLNQASVKGGDFGEGATVHVFYKLEDESKVVTLVVEKIKSRKAYRSQN